MSTDPTCSHRPPCPGCPRFGEAGVPAEALSALQSLTTSAGIAGPSLAQGPAFGYRHRARLSVRGRSRSPKIGIFQLGSHQIVDIPRCPIHHPLINRVVATVKRVVREQNIAPYVERTHHGDLRGIQVVVERESQAAQVVLIANDSSAARLRAPAESIQEELGSSLHSLWWNGNPERTNTILGPHWELLCGEPAVRETVAGVQVYFPPGAFGQSNLELADRVVETIRSRVPDDARIVEFYAGCGPIGLGLLGRCRTLIFNELARDSLAGLELGLRARPATERARAKLRLGTAGECADLVASADVVIADPPRKGLDSRLVAALRQDPPVHFFYLSCGRESFLRDCAELGGSGGLRLRAVDAYALFPHTEHVETLAHWTRND